MRIRPDSAFMHFHRENVSGALMRRLLRIRSVFRSYKRLIYPNMPWIGDVPRENVALIRMRVQAARKRR